MWPQCVQFFPRCCGSRLKSSLYLTIEGRLAADRKVICGEYSVRVRGGERIKIRTCSRYHHLSPDHRTSKKKRLNKQWNKIFHPQITPRPVGGNSTDPERKGDHGAQIKGQIFQLSFLRRQIRVSLLCGIFGRLVWQKGKISRPANLTTDSKVLAVCPLSCGLVKRYGRFSHPSKFHHSETSGGSSVRRFKFEPQYHIQRPYIAVFEKAVGNV